MKREERNLMTPPLEKLLERIPQKYELVLTATRRAKQILREQRLQSLGPNALQTMEKPLSLALQDIVGGQIDRESLFAPDLELDDFEDESDIFPDIDVLEGTRAGGNDDAVDADADTDSDDDDLDDLDFNLIDDEPLEAE